MILWCLNQIPTVTSRDITSHDAKRIFDSLLMSGACRERTNAPAAKVTKQEKSILVKEVMPSW
jgi:hypothetical protein